MPSHIDLFLNHLSKRASRHTVLAYKVDLQQLLAWLSAKKMKLESLRAADLEDYFDSLPFQRSTSRRKLAAVSSYCKFLVKRGVLEKNPAIDVSPIKIKRRKPNFLTVDEMYVLKDSLRDREPWLYTVISLFLASGMRLSELLGLKTYKVNIKAKTVSVIGKGDKERVIPITSQCALDLKLYLLSKKDNSGYVFSNDGKPFTASKVYWHLTKQARQILHRHVHPHMLRHTFGTVAASVLSLPEVKELMGHEHIETTSKYTHVPPGLRERYDEKVGKLIEGE